MSLEEDYGKIIINKNLQYQRSFYHTASSLAQSMFYHVVGAGHFICCQNFHLYRYDYDNILIKYTLRGKGRLVYHGKTYILQPGQLFIINCFDVQEYATCLCDEWENKWIHFSGCMSREYFNLIYNNYGPVLTMPRGNHIAEQIDSILDMMEARDLNFEIKASAIILNILTEVLVCATQAQRANDLTGYNTIVANSIIFIENNYNHPLKLAEIAEKVNFSPYHFIRVFKRITGFTPYEYLSKYRINRSKFLLTTTNQTIAEIATQIGFLNVNSYIRAFHKFEGKTPTQYRILFQQS